MPVARSLHACLLACQTFWSPTMGPGPCSTVLRLSSWLPCLQPATPSFSSQRQGRGSANSSPGLACGLGKGMELPSAGLCPGHHAVAYSYQSTCTGLQWPPPAPSAESSRGLGLWFPSPGITPVKPDTVPKEGPQQCCFQVNSSSRVFTFHLLESN